MHKFIPYILLVIGIILLISTNIKYYNRVKNEKDSIEYLPQEKTNKCISYVLFGVAIVLAILWKV